MHSGPAPLSGLRVVEVSSFVAAPSAGLALAQLGADVIRVDPPGGGSDANRWPLARSGASLFWANLNKGKRSVAIDHRSPEGRELLLALACAPGPDAGVLLDNLVGRHRLRYEDLCERRPDVIHAHIEGHNDGSPAVDYTINAEVGVPTMTGPAETQTPVNHVLPAWDLLSGMTVAMAIVTAVLHRCRTGEGARLELSLADLALTGVGNMGWLAEADSSGRARPRQGNHMFGAFGVDFETADRRRVMVVALTGAQWRALREVTETSAVFAALQDVLGADLDDEGDRYRHRETIAAVLRPWFAQRDFGTVEQLLRAAKVLWSPYLDMAEVAHRAAGDASSGASRIDQPGIGPMLSTGRPLRWNSVTTGPVPAPVMGEHGAEVLAEVLGLSTREIGRLRDRGIVGGADCCGSPIGDLPCTI
ncbi:2-methylfumaryl-CoA isomerase [Kribbella sp. VKM Ac-2527]|uniref:2-methylfumaryl-CoA isomerase n=2 Tax=Kribbella caucasensis TaxID=2512215 RepID=A0A4V3CAU4_9ACTN|nr:2-methylfumaryl-CoA isomerase [Kribbella sp. VKM Ac-2527]